jgi:hypothetical protein
VFEWFGPGSKVPVQTWSLYLHMFITGWVVCGLSSIHVKHPLGSFERSRGISPVLGFQFWGKTRREGEWTSAIRCSTCSFTFSPRLPRVLFKEGMEQTTLGVHLAYAAREQHFSTTYDWPLLIRRAPKYHRHRSRYICHPHRRGIKSRCSQTCTNNRSFLEATDPCH